MTIKPDTTKEQPNTWTQGGQAKSSDAAAMAEHIRHFGTSAKGKTESFDQLAKRHAERKAGLGWKEAWMLRLEMLGQKTRLPRGFKMVPMRVINYVQCKGV
ncbi:hypothetical protein HX878_20630 [Pseudomonas veronii]|uniref:hypothetical protein n=1 Tax=Pseudomonas veronii TaxID=76761 RepID=UPI0015A3B025|nr:hypothetical protein [Pseudomonas veronii]NWD57140.1 hypothetical protein [Pseudomonas veronii]